MCPRTAGSGPSSQKERSVRPPFFRGAAVALLTLPARCRRALKIQFPLLLLALPAHFTPLPPPGTARLTFPPLHHHDSSHSTPPPPRSGLLRGITTSPSPYTVIICPSLLRSRTCLAAILPARSHIAAHLAHPSDRPMMASIPWGP